jgi:hypothetical protein
MKVVAVIVMGLGLALMSAPLVLPRLGISLTVPSLKAEDAPLVEGTVGVAALEGQLAQGVGPLAADAGVIPAKNAGSPEIAAAEIAAAEIAAAEIAAACAALSDAGADEADCPAEQGGIIGTSVAWAANMIWPGETSDEASAPTAAAAPEDRAAGVSILAPSESRPAGSGAKFVKARDFGVGEDSAP